MTRLVRLSAFHPSIVHSLALSRLWSSGGSTYTHLCLPQQQQQMFHLWFNTGYIDNNYLCFQKSVLDKACKVGRAVSTSATVACATHRFTHNTLSAGQEEQALCSWLQGGDLPPRCLG